MHRRHRFTPILLAGMLSITFACTRQPPVSTGDSSADTSPGPAPGAVFIEKPVTFCWQRPVQTRKGDVQVLIDGSGSMVGFKESIPAFQEWAAHAVSQLQGSTLQSDSTRLCQFSQGQGIFKCGALGKAQAGFQAAGNTNLDEAIRSSKDYALTFILTDGVAATGGRGSADCASGVDAACVARSLSQAIHAQPADGGDTDRGVWVMPLVTKYDGVFYTEESINPASFQPSETIQQIRSDMNIPSVVQEPKVGSDGRLNFTYKGPRSLLLIVIARWADVGRSAVQALWERTEYLRIQRLGQMKDYTSGLASFQPVELYPGFLNQVQWRKLQESDDPSARVGTMDAFFEAGPPKTVIGLTCPGKGSGESDYRLEGTSATSQVSGCVPIQMMAGFNFKLSPARSGDDPEMAGFIQSAEREKDSSDALKLRLHCSMDAPRFCGDNPLALQWTAYMDYAKAADGLADSNQAGRVQRDVVSISTAHPSHEPHRIFALSTTLESFYREVAQDQRSVILGSLEICHKR